MTSCPSTASRERSFSTAARSVPITLVFETCWERAIDASDRPEARGLRMIPTDIFLAMLDAFL
jgi:hypothetical protein